MTDRPYWLGAAVAAIGVVWLYQALSLPQQAQYAQIGPGFFVSLVGAALIALGALLTWQIHNGETFEAQNSEDVDADAQASWPALGFTVAATVLPMLAIDVLGFPATATLMFLLVSRAFGSRRYLLNAVIGIAFSVICWLGFSALGVQLGGLLPAMGL
ncbi:MAG: tripartite tricarboxylate transporter TctB family protein [Rhizobiaceae bacterium]|jgi:putative tricarboxylic transport membrane protein|nr:tripartite tricarboxylate transporter TctB family protein [Rhizobiaceae bacterium]